MTPPLYPRKESWYLLNRKLDGVQNLSKHFGEEKHLLPLLGTIGH